MEGRQAGVADVSLEAALQLIVRSGPAFTVAACLLLKAVFLALHLLALRLPACSGLEKLSLLHWSYDVWNVWCLAVFVRTGQLPWSLETCVVYHVLGYLVYSLVYLHLHNREVAARDGGLSRMTGTPDSELTVQVSEEEEQVTPTRHLFTTPGGLAIISEDVPDEDEDPGRLKGGRSQARPAASRDELCSVPEERSTLTSGHPVPPREAGAETGESGNKAELKKLDGVEEDGARVSEDRAELRDDDRGPKDGEGPVKEDSPERRQSSDRPYRKLDAAGGQLERSPPADSGQEVTEDVAAALKASKQRDLSSGGPLDADITGFNKYSPVKADRADPCEDIVKVPLDPTDSQQLGDGDQPGRQDAQGGGEDGDRMQDNAVLNGDHNGIQNGDHEVQDGDHYGIPNGDRH